MNPAYDSLQQRCLEALGYTVYALAGNEAASKLVTAQLPSRALQSPAPLAREHRLLAAVLKAARLQMDTIDDAQHWLGAHGVDSIAALRTDPGAKRALWIKLRRERRAP